MFELRMFCVRTCHLATSQFLGKGKSFERLILMCHPLQDGAKC
jgi:hypothetical protein